MSIVIKVNNKDIGIVEDLKITEETLNDDVVKGIAHSIQFDRLQISSAFNGDVVSHKSQFAPLVMELNDGNAVWICQAWIADYKCTAENDEWVTCQDVEMDFENISVTLDIEE